MTKPHAPNERQPSASLSSNPSLRPRRLRRGQRLRTAIADVSLSTRQLILPVFVTDKPVPVPIASMPGVTQWPVESAVNFIAQMATKGIHQFMLFGVTPASHKDTQGSYALSANNPVCRTLSLVKQAKLDVIMYADLCLCEYTDHGHCGPLCDDQNWVVDNDATLKLLGEQAVVLATAGADVVAPSGMMDHMVAAIRTALDAASRTDVAILSYSVKFASSMYGPFREAGEGGMQFGDRKGYQMDYRRSREWRTELLADIAQGADMVIVKPAATYLDVIAKVRDTCDVPVAAYHVSGEYAMLCAAAEKGWLQLPAAVMETTYAMRRAGADLIITYFAPQIAQWLLEEK